MENIICITDASTDVTINRPMTADELERDLLHRNEVEVIEKEKRAEAEAKATAKAALLAQLGITEEQAKLLLS